MVEEASAHLRRPRCWFPPGQWQLVFEHGFEVLPTVEDAEDGDQVIGYIEGDGHAPLESEGA
jgi:hypothetical protein